MTNPRHPFQGLVHRLLDLVQRGRGESTFEMHEERSQSATLHRDVEGGSEEIHARRTVSQHARGRREGDGFSGSFEMSHRSQESAVLRRKGTSGSRALPTDRRLEGEIGEPGSGVPSTHHEAGGEVVSYSQVVETKVSFRGHLGGGSPEKLLAKLRGRGLPEGALPGERPVILLPAAPPKHIPARTSSSGTGEETNED